ncbi:hypothetical protein PYW08_001420 [Mythimna loreyi]|uniref:Uncharacterized protein n=1 Tax=Mythimna loreyi TaxID=667449 RepID=A0ACC2R625_9NEOP|nr:hypothetical protein PYW08_001420 [Mythimna loreyi]
MSRKSQRVDLKSQAREIISKVYDFMKKEASKNYAEKITDARWRTAQAVGVSESTVTRILRERKENTNTMEQTIPAKESNVTVEMDAIVSIAPSAERTTEQTTEADIESENKASTSHSNLVFRSASIFTSPMKKRRVVPEWRMMDQFVLDIQKVFHIDAELSANPMNNPVYTPTEISGTFGAITYPKSAAVIRMMQNFLTPEVFRKGLVIYIRNNSRSAASPLNLYASLQEALDASNHSIPYPLCDVMNLWTNQAGFPVLTVTRSADQSIVIEQARYLTNNTERSNNRWHVPINWVLSTNPDFSDTRPQHWVPPSFPARSFDIPGLSNASWYIINKQQTGYYRVNYDTQNWAALATALNNNHEVIHVLIRAQLIDDAFDLASNGRLSYEYALRISNYLVKEKDYIPWAAAYPVFNYLDEVLSSSTWYNLFQDYLLNLTAPLTNPKQRLNPDIQTLVYCSGLRGGSAENFNFLWDMYLASSDSSEQSILLNALGCTSNEERRTLVRGLTGTTNILNASAGRLTNEAHYKKIEEFFDLHQGIYTA